MLPFPIRFAIQIDLALNAYAAVGNSDHVMIGASQIGQFGVLVAAGIILHELIATTTKAVKIIHRWWQHRKEHQAHWGLWKRPAGER
jgi:hypothetical protein